MGGAAPTPSGKGGKKPVDAAIVPMRDSSEGERIVVGETISVGHAVLGERGRRRPLHPVDGRGSDECPPIEGAAVAADSGRCIRSSGS